MSQWQPVTQSEPGVVSAHDRIAPRMDTERMKVPGGWLYRTVVAGPGAVGVGLCFVPDGGAAAGPKKPLRRR